MAMNLHSRDSAKMANSKLEKKYKTSLFDFSYMLSAVLCDEFLPKNEKALSKREFASLGNALRNASNLLQKYGVFEDLRKATEQKLDLLNKQGCHEWQFLSHMTQ